MWIDELQTPMDWEGALPFIQFELNNAPSAATGKAPTEVVRGATANDPSRTMTGQTARLLDIPTSRIEASDRLFSFLKAWENKWIKWARHKRAWCVP